MRSFHLRALSKLEHLSLSASATLALDGVPEILPALKTLRARTKGARGGVSLL